MEALPRLPMISFELKTSTDATDIQAKLRNYIKYYYNEDTASYNDDFNQLEGLRATAIRPPKDTSGCAIMKRYYCQLQYLQTRFPMGKDGDAAITVKWRDPYSESSVTQSDVALEFASILYNIGALHSLLGASDNRTTADGMKMACSHFQCAAWAFQHVLQEFPQVMSYDVSSDLLAFMSQVCLAQAQECILEKSMMDNRKASNIMKIAVQTAEFYRQSLKHLTPTQADDSSLLTMGIKWHKKWMKYAKFKVAYYSCIGLLYQGQQAEEERKMGERVAFYQAAYEKLEESRKLMKNLDQAEAIQETLQFTQDVVEGKRKAANNENEFIYHEQVPAANLLPEIKGAALVKGIGFNVNDPDVAGPDIFARLVPISAHQTSSIYTDELSKMQRKITAAVVKREEELDSFLATLQMDDLQNIDDWQLPQDLIDRCAAFHAKPEAIQNLMDAMHSLSDTFQDVENMLSEIRSTLQREEEAVMDYEKVVGKRPPSITATDLTREANKYQDAHAKASESNQTLHKAMELHLANLRLLSLPLRELKNQIPTISFDSEDEEKAIRDMQHLMNKVNEMRHQRGAFVGILRDDIQKDDITHLIVTYTGENKEDLFKQEMNKHTKQINLIKQNLSAQDKILGAIQDHYGKYNAAKRNLSDKIQRRDAMVASLNASYDAYEDLLAKSSKGQEFYSKLQSNVGKLLQRVRSTCKVQEEEREQVLANILDDVPRGTARATMPNTAMDVMPNNLRDKRSPSNLDTNLPSGVYVPPSGGMKLKDYLNMKKETGSMSLIASSTPGAAYAATGYPAAPAYDPSPLSWVPGIRPAPVGSEETEPATPRQIDATATPNWYPMPLNNRPGDKESTPVAYQQAYPKELYGYEAHSSLQPGYSEHNIPYSTNYPAQVPSRTDYSIQNPMSLDAKGASMQGNLGTDNNIAMFPNTHGARAYDFGHPPTTALPHGSNYSSQYAQPTALSSDAPYGSQQIPQNVTTGSYNNVPGHLSTPYSSVPVRNNQDPAATVAAVSLPQSSGYSVEQNNSYPVAGYGNQPGGPLAAPSNYPVNHSIPNQGVAYSQYMAPQVLGGAMQQNTAYPIHPQSPSLGSSAQNAYQHTNQPSTQIPPSLNYSSATDPVNYASVGYASTAIDQTGGIKLTGYEVPRPDITDNLNVNQPKMSPIPQVPMSTQGSASSSLPSLPKPEDGTQPNANSKPNLIVSHLAVDYTRAFAQPASNVEYPPQINNHSAILPSSSNNTCPQPNNTYTPFMQSDGAIGPSSLPQRVSPSHITLNYKNDLSGQNYGAVPLSNIQGSNKATNQQYIPPMSGDFKQGAEYLQYGNLSYYTQTSRALDYSTITSGLYNANKTPTPTAVGPPYSIADCADQFLPQPVGNAATQSPVTYRQAGNISKAATTTTNSSTNSMTSPLEKPSNVDLLAELDFSVSQTPLQPNIPVANEDRNVSKAIAPSEPTESTPKKVPVKEETVVVQVKKEAEEKVMDVESLKAFVPEVEKFEKFVEGLTVKTLNGPTTLDVKWKEISEIQEKDSQSKIISVARCYPMKNRFPDILPYDESRVELPSTKDDYINASYMEPLTPGLNPFILTQAPIPVTYVDFWTMVMEKQVEVIINLLGVSEDGGHVYWPAEKGQELQLGVLRLSLQSCNTRTHWIERIFSLNAADTKQTRIIVHLQFTSWPGSSFPASPAPFLMFVQEVTTYLQQQRNPNHPAVVHCLSGVGRTGLFCLTLAAMHYIRSGRGIPDLVLLATRMSRCRKNCLRDREHLKFAYQSLLYFSQDLLMKNGILTSRGIFDEKKSSQGKCHVRHPSEDFLIPNDAAQIQSRLEAVNLDDDAPSQSNCIEQRRDDAVEPATNPLLPAMDPKAFSLSTSETKPPKGKQKFTPDKFTASSSTNLSVANASDSDPLSSLDPLWSLKK